MIVSRLLQVSDLVHYMSSTAHSYLHFSTLVADYIHIVSISEHMFQCQKVQNVHFDP